MEIYKVPTGEICIMKGEKGLPLEFLSIGDYGKEKNVKADFMGLSEEINGVPHGDLLPLEKKWVITISSQYGCSMNCSFCDVPKVGKGLNATEMDMVNQIYKGIELHPEVEKTERLNVHFARMGEPTWNRNVIYATADIISVLKTKGWGVHPVVSTMMPKNNKNLFKFLQNWLEIKDVLNGEAGLQISLNTTDDDVRKNTMPYAMTICEISDMFYDLLSIRKIPKGRKIALNFALTNAEINAQRLRDLFNPRYFMCKITPMHMTKACIKNRLITDGGYDYYYPYKEVEGALKSEGFDVLVFIPSKEEDASKITCGNVILAKE